MENLPHSIRSEMINEQPFKPAFNDRELSLFNAGENPLFDKMAEEDLEDFFHYLDWLGLAKNPNIMVLSSMHHYYYDMNDLKGVRILVNLKHLNRIKHLNGFLHSIFRLLPPGARFLGCFEEDRNPEGMAATIYQSVKLFSEIINLLDSRTDRRMTRRAVSKIMQSHGFRIVDMTEINETIYFMSVNTRGCAT